MLGDDGPVLGVFAKLVFLLGGVFGGFGVLGDDLTAGEEVGASFLRRGGGTGSSTEEG